MNLVKTRLQRQFNAMAMMANPRNFAGSVEISRDGADDEFDDMCEQRVWTLAGIEHSND